MKLSNVVVLALAGSASAFIAPSSMKNTYMTLRMGDNQVETSEVNAVDKDVPPSIPLDKDEETTPPISLDNIETTPSSLSDKSKSIPFLDRPPALDGTLAGDVGFDPLGFAKTKDDLLKYREAEIKHARLAMLAAAGWPLSELFDRKIANVIGAAPALVDDRAPSILNGGLGKISPLYWVACLAAAAAIDLYGIKVASKKPGYTPGDLGFDPLGVYPKDPEGKKWFDLAEIKNGRLAMIAITAFAFQELVTQQGVVNETPLFFKPLDETLREYANSGYVQ